MLLFLVGFGGIAAKLVSLQALSHDFLNKAGLEQRSRLETLEATRGRILDRNGAQLAVTVAAPTIIANPKLIPDAAVAAEQIAPIVGIDAATLAKRFRQKNSSFAYVARQVDQSVADRVKALAIPGIEFQSEPRRFYPSGDLASPVLGVVGIDDNGLAGSEYLLNHTLTGHSGSRREEVDQFGRRIPETEQHLKPAAPGKDVVLTMDSGIQYEAQQALIDEVTRVNADGAVSLVMDLKTGDILAAATVTKGEDGTVRAASGTDRNRPFTDVYEPGSTNKIITMSAAIESGLVGPQTVLDVPLTISQGGAFQRDEHRAKGGPLSVTQIFEMSSNVGTIKIAQLLGADRFDTALRKFGFGSVSNVGFPGEASGVLLDRSNYSDTSMITMPIGYGIAVTPMQMLDVFATIANDGVPVKPRLVLGTQLGGAFEAAPTPEPAGRVVSVSTARSVRGMLEGVVAATGGTGKKAQIPGYSVAGKTGTALKAPYNKGEHFSSFAGFAPASNPQLATIVVLDNARNEYYGGDVAAPAFKRIMSYALDVRHVPADQPLPANQ
ncbi:MAG: penicillin-binding protein 2 [Acidimicrobiia bacterium]